MRGLTPRVFEDLFARIDELKANTEVRHMHAQNAGAALARIICAFRCAATALA